MSRDPPEASVAWTKATGPTNPADAGDVLAEAVHQATLKHN
jgi:hypothetical protein